MIGLGLTACQKDDMPEAPATQENVAPQASTYSLYPSGDIDLCLHGDKLRFDFKVLKNGVWYQGGFLKFWIEDIYGSYPLSQHVELSAGPAYITWYVTGYVKLKQTLQEPTRGYLKCQDTQTGETISVPIRATPALIPEIPLI